MEYKWRAFSVNSIAVLMVAIDSTVVLLAIAPIVENLRSTFVTIVWVILAYLLVTTTFGLTLGRLGDLFGRKRVFISGFAVFTLGSALCGAAPNGLDLVGFRVVQGFGAALVLSSTFAILSEAFPPRERGMAFGANSVVWGGGSILGIVLGGVIIAYFSWRWIFLINIPIGIVGTLWAARALRADPPRAADAAPPRFDLPAAGSFTGGILALLLGVSWGLLYGWHEPVTLGSLALAPFFFAFLAVWEVRFAKDPIFHREFFQSAVFTASVTSAFLQSLALFSVNFLLLFYFEGIAGVPVLNAALLVVPMGVVSAIAGPISGRLTDRRGPKYIAAGGLGVQALVIFLFTRLTTSTPLWEVAVLEGFYGMGGGMFWPANTSTIMSASPRGKFGVGSGIMNTFRNTGMILSFAVSLTAITAVLPGRVVGELFLGTTTSALSAANAASYLSGQSFAFSISLVLLLASLALVLWKAPGARPTGVAAGAPQGASRPGAVPPGTSRPAESATSAAAAPPSYSGSPK